MSLPPDPTFPRLAQLLEPGLMSARLEPFLAGPGERLQSLEVERLRYRPGRRCIVQYGARVVGADGSVRRELAAGTLYPNADELTARHRRQLRQLGAEAAAGPPAAGVVPELDLLVERFPFDRKLPGLRALDGALEEMVDAGWLLGLGAGDWLLEERSLEPVRWRSGLSAVLRYRLQARERRQGQLCQRTFYVKTRHQAARNGGLELGSLETVHGRPGPWPFAFPRVRAWLPEHGLVVQDEAPGDPLARVLADPARSAPAARQVGLAVAALHRARLSGQVPHDAEPADTHRVVAARLAELCPGLGPRLADVVEAVAPMLAGAARVPVHGDLKPEHIHCADAQVVLLDLDCAAVGDPMGDVARLLVQMELAAGEGAGPGLTPGRRFAAAFLDAYADAVPADWFASLPARLAVEHLRLALHHFTVQTPGWRQRIPELVTASLTVARGACGSMMGAPLVAAAAPQPAAPAGARVQA